MCLGGEVSVEHLRKRPMPGAKVQRCGRKWCQRLLTMLQRKFGSEQIVGLAGEKEQR